MFEGCGGCCLALVVIPLLCCGLVAGAVAYTTINAPDPPIRDNYQASQADAQAFDAEVARAASMAVTQGWFWTAFTQEQFSSWLSLKGQDFAESQDRRFPFEDVQVGFNGGLMRFYGKFTQSGVKVPLLVELRPRVDGNGKLAMDIENANVGGLDLPDFVLGAIKDQLEAAVNRPFQGMNGAYFLNAATLTVDNGRFEIQGQPT
ncbi:hypothetical protein [Aggregatilinea lenta]|uniref:hypothetical protein n=1 Tax=Aggregatilinea lenta TaxID=913108 RepID=UPI000E5A9B32|nr:hypothetical protein [Aggregatilinea lenta]